MNARVQSPRCQGSVLVTSEFFVRLFAGPRCSQASLSPPSAGLEAPEPSGAGRIASWLLAVTPSRLLLSAITAVAVVSFGCGEPAPPPAKEAAKPAEEPPPPPPAPKPIRLAELSPVMLDPGERATVELTVERNGNEGPIRVELEGVPEGISINAIEIADGESAGRLEVAAAEKLGDEELQATLRVIAKVGDLEAKQALALTVNKLSLPSFQPAKGVLLQPGKTAAVSLSLQRKGYEGPLELGVEGLPEKVTGKVQTIAAGQNAAKLEIAVAADAPDGSHTIGVAARLYGRTIDVKVPLQIIRNPYRVRSFMVVTLKPGETKSVQVPVERRGYNGPLHLEVTNVPEGMTVQKVEVAPDQKTATLELAAAADAKECVRSGEVVSTGADLTRTDPMVVRVSHGESGFLPREVTADPQMMHLLRRGSFGGRLTAASKQALLDAYGGTPESEAAVLRGLRWLAEHQQPDGRWPLKGYSEGVPRCDCETEPQEKVVDYDSAGTAFGVLPFLGAGVTHNPEFVPKSPPELLRYTRNVYHAIASLVKNQDSKSGNLGGNLYSHALGTMALCEAYGLTNDDRLKVPAQLAIKYLMDAQHPEGGGWRYSPKQPGDMSSTGWMFLAIRCGQLAGMSISRSPLTRAERFVNSCAAGPEEAKLSRYCYQPGQDARLSLTAAGLLTRQYLGRSKDDPDLLAGCKYLMQNLPPESGDKLGHIYYYYYATQVLHHMEGSDFDLWNYRMREHLIRMQEKDGHKAGSWNPEGTNYGDRGGRLYSTSMALMTLQVYYRHLPMYRPVQRTSD